MTEVGMDQVARALDQSCWHRDLLPVTVSSVVCRDPECRAIDVTVPPCRETRCGSMSDVDVENNHRGAVAIECARTDTTNEPAQLPEVASVQTAIWLWNLGIAQPPHRQFVEGGKSVSITRSKSGVLLGSCRRPFQRVRPVLYPSKCQAGVVAG
jgi:hypothetical protein